MQISAGALGKGIPHRDLLLSRQHRVLIRWRLVERMFHLDEALVPANKLVGQPGIAIDESLPAVHYFHPTG